MKRICMVLPIIIVLGFVFSCSAPPKEEMEKAHDAVIRAENDADAVMYAPTILVRARDALTRMQNEADAKRYDAAKTYAAEAVMQAERAINEGQAGAARTKTEAENLLSSLSGPLAETSSALDAAWNVDKVLLDFTALSTNLETARKTYNEALQSLQKNNYRDAISQGQTVRSLLADINSALTVKVQEVVRKK